MTATKFFVTAKPFERDGMKYVSGIRGAVPIDEALASARHMLAETGHETVVITRGPENCVTDAEWKEACLALSKVATRESFTFDDLRAAISSVERAR